MKKQWRHSALGKLVPNGKNSRRGKLNISAFAAFSYDTGYSNARRSTGDIHFSLSPYFMGDKLDEPTPEMIAIAEKIVTEPNTLVELVVHALWDDFNGTGPDSGIWWHGNLKSIRETFEDMKLPQPTQARDLLQVLQLYDIAVFDKSDELQSPLAYLTFHTAFEEEHGVTLLFDGTKIIGAGFAGGDASPYKPLRDPKRLPPKNPFKPG